MREKVVGRPHKLREIPVEIDVFIESKQYMDRKETIYPTVMPYLKEINTDGKYDEAVLTGGIGAAKALALDTPVPTPFGWTTLGEVRDGDWIYGETGKPVRVLKAHPVLFGESCYLVEMNTGETFTASGDHLWYVHTKGDRANYGGRHGRVRATTDLNVKDANAIRIAGPLQGQYVSSLGIDPYTLGVWLGDGSNDSARVCISDGVSKTLRKLGLLDNKHIPRILFRASITQRIALLQGLMDSDGACDYRTGRCSFTNVNKQLAEDVLELVRGLGWRPSIKKLDARLNTQFICNGWKISWITRYEFPVFRLFHKLSRQGIRAKRRKTSHSMWHIIKRITPVISVPVRCLTVDNPTSLYLVGETLVPTHNTTIALYSTAYQLYRLSLYNNPHAEFNLDQASEIVFIFQSLNATAAKQVDFTRFREMIEQSPYFKNRFPPDKNIMSKLVFSNRIEVQPVSGSETAAIGQNVIGGVIDELNYMAVIENSSKSMDKGIYDQAVELYNSIARRRKSRFMMRGNLPGLLCLVSSKRYPGQFTDMKEEEARTDPKIFIYDKRTWDIRPEAYGGQTFPVFIGDDARRPRLLQQGERIHAKDRELVMQIPIEHKIEFEKDIINALREVAGVSTLAKSPYIVMTDKIGEGMRGGNVFTAEFADFERYKLGISKGWANPDALRFAHVDLGVTSDNAGIAIGHVSGFKKIQRTEGHYEVMPEITIDGCLAVPPPPSGEINFEKVRDIFYIIRDQLEIPLKWITYDSFQSVDSLQLLRSRGFVTGTQSMDKTRYAYDLMKGALYQDRLILPYHEKLRRELASLEDDPETGKVDHPPHGSKDIADAIAGVVYGLTMRREIWTAWGVSPELIPSWLRDLGQADKRLDEVTA